MFRALRHFSCRALGVFFCPFSHMMDQRREAAPGGSSVLIPILPAKRLTTQLYRLIASTLLRLGRYDVAFTRSPAFAQIPLNLGLSTVLELHASPRPSSRDDRDVARVWSHINLRRIVTISKALAEDLVAQYGPPHSGCDVVVAHDGAEAGAAPAPARRHAERLRIGYFGHLYPGKGMETIATLAPRLPEMDFDVYGGTEADIVRWRGAVEGQPNLRLHGHIPHGDVRARMEECDVLIAPYGVRVSHVGGGDIARWMSPLKLFEYMAAGRAVVCADLPVLREVVKDEATALLAPPEDIAAWAEALRRLAADPDLRLALGEAGRDLLVAEYTWQRRAERVFEGLTAPCPFANAGGD